MANKKSPSKIRPFLMKLFHTIAIIQFSYAIYYNVVFVNFPKHIMPNKLATYGGKFKYLTFLCSVNKILANLSAE